MPFPSGLKTVECRFPVPFDYVDGEDLTITGTLEIVLKGTHTIYWKPTNQEIGTFVNEVDIVAGGSFQLPAVDQDGVIDDSGRGYQYWAYRATYKISDAHSQGREVSKLFQPLVSDVGVGIDVPALPTSSGTTGAPIVSQRTVDVSQIRGLDEYLATHGGGGGGNGSNNSTQSSTVGAKEYIQSTPLATWTITHSLSRFPMVDVYIGGEQVEADVTVTTSNATIKFPTPMAGRVVLS